MLSAQQDPGTLRPGVKRVAQEGLPELAGALVTWATRAQQLVSSPQWRGPSQMHCEVRVLDLASDALRLARALEHLGRGYSGHYG